MADAAVLRISGLCVSYGSSQALHDVSLELGGGIHAVLGRNGVGKTTLCNAIMGLVPVARGGISYKNRDLLGLAPHQRAALGIGYTPQGRRLWKSLSVQEHLRLCERKGGRWSAERVYATFPRLRERSSSSATQLSGGEQQMLAIGRALLSEPDLLILDEPTEGLAPVIVEHVEEQLSSIAGEGGVTILLVEQNVRVATNIARDITVMVNGTVGAVVPAAQLAENRELQRTLLGVSTRDDLAAQLADLAQDEQPQEAAAQVELVTAERQAAGRGWGSSFADSISAPVAAAGSGTIGASLPFDIPVTPLYQEARADATSLPEATGSVLVAGTFSTKAKELDYLRSCLLEHGVAVRTVDLSTTGEPSDADVTPGQVAACNPHGAGAVFTGDRGSAIREMALAFESWLSGERGVRGIISAAGSGGTSLVTPAMRSLPLGVPKIMISTVASGEVSRYVGASDIMMMYSVTDVQGLNEISTTILRNGAAALAGMLERRGEVVASAKPSVGLTMFGVTTPAVQQVSALLEEEFDCLVFHATGVGGQSLEKLVDNGLLAAAVDLTTTEVCDLLMGGVFPATEDRFGSYIRRPIPCVISVGALDMVNFGPPESVPPKYADRLFYEHNPQVTLMRTTPEENARMGEWIAGRLNRIQGPLRLLLPVQGVSALDAPGMPFHDPAASQALFDSLDRHFESGASRRVAKLPCHINDALFAERTVEALREIME